MTETRTGNVARPCLTEAVARGQINTDATVDAGRGVLRTNRDQDAQYVLLHAERVTAILAHLHAALDPIARSQATAS